MDQKEIFQICKTENVKFIRLWFTDILGILKGFSITIDELERAFEEGMGFDGSSIEGFVRIDESDMVALPDPNTFRLLTWKPKEDIRVAAMFCDIVTPDRKPYQSDPRYILGQTLESAKELGYDFYVGPELEFFYFKSSKGKPEPLDHGGYFDVLPLDIAGDLRKQTIIALKEMGMQVEYSHHEVGPSQHEIDLRYQKADIMADWAMLYRLVVKDVARQHDVYATFMPKPLYGHNGSGMHVHMSLFKGEKNHFFDATSPDHLSKEAKQFIGGLLKYAPEMTLITNQWVNSYKRLVPGYEAPVYVTWGSKNRSDLIRVPHYSPGREKSTRIELRCPDPACNPYLAFAVMLAAGLEGIKNNMECPIPIEENVYAMSMEQRREKNIKQLPSDLHDAITLAEKSDLLKKTLGEDLLQKLLRNKKKEWADYSGQVTAYELENYLPIL